MHYRNHINKNNKWKADIQLDSKNGSITNDIYTHTHTHTYIYI